MNYVYGRSMVVMDSVNDRMRFKDKIIANVAKAVKSIQELQILSISGTVTLGNYDWQCHRLCEHLDHTLLHGLRHVTPGYWKIVSEFTHRDCVKEIKRMRNVTTDLGRGRAWLFMALNECLLESYLRCYQQNERLAENYYVRDAIVRDQDKFNILLTIISGLESIEFQLECDMPYLDLCVFPPNSKHTTNVESTIDFDRLSMCSMESVYIPSSKPLPQAVFETDEISRPSDVNRPSDVGKPGEVNRPSDKDLCSTGNGEQRYSPSLDSGIHSDWNYRQRSITPIDQMSISNTSQDSESAAGSGLEVIHLSKKGKPQKHKRKRKKFVSVSSISEPDVAEIHNNVDGPIIEIPPIDNIKLLKTIINCQNNNDPNLENVLTPEDEAILCSRVRSPGDGIDNVTDRVDGSVNSVQHRKANGDIIDAKKVDIGQKDDGLRQTLNKSDIYATTFTDNDTHDLSDINNVEKEKSRIIPYTMASSNSDSGIFTKLIEARVSNIVNAGEQIESEEYNSEQIDSANVENPDDRVVFQFRDDANETFGIYSDLYDVVSVKEESGDESKDANTDKTIEIVPEVPSIYSRRDEADLSSDEDTESFSQNFDSSGLQKGEMSRNGTSSRGSNNSTPIHDLRNIQNVSENGEVSEDLDKTFVSMEKVLVRNHDMRSRHSDSSLYGRLSNRNTPDMVSANQNRSKSGVSFSSANEIENEYTTNKMSRNSRSSSRMSTNETEDESTNRMFQISRSSSRMSTNETEDESTNRMSQNSRSSSRMSASDMTGYRNSPCPSTDDERTSVSTPSGTHSPSTDLEASGKVLQAKVEELIVQRKLNQYTHLTFGEDDDDDDDDNFNDLPTPSRDRAASQCAGEVELDNNTMLYLMLDVLNEDETIVKMFCCQLGHTEGKIKTILFLISLESVYILQPQSGKKKFVKLAVISFQDIDFVSIGCNNQIVHLACKNKRQKYWLTTGEGRITIAIVDCLADSMEKCENKPGKLEVDTGNTIQKISLQKYVATECKCESVDAEVICYSLVHWEDPTTDKGSCEWDREGTLYYKSNETANILGNQTWRLAFAALRDSMLCLYNDKNDAKPSHFLNMGGGQCVGCKRDFNCDKNHAIKIMCSDGTFWSVALDSEDEANRWLQGLCQAVSEGMKMNTARASCVPCCMVLCKQKLLMCHEDLETNFIRTLGSANLHDITTILSDELTMSYLVLVFESDEETVTNEKWVLYFNSDHESNRFKISLSNCWFNHFQIELPVLPNDDFSLQKKCTEMVHHLQSARTLDNR